MESMAGQSSATVMPVGATKGVANVEVLEEDGVDGVDEEEPDVWLRAEVVVGEGQELEVFLVPSTAPTTIAAAVAARNMNDRTSVVFLNPNIVPAVAGLELPSAHGYVVPVYSFVVLPSHCGDC